jgi:hypothetical protein
VPAGGVKAVQGSTPAGSNRRMLGDDDAAQMRRTMTNFTGVRDDESTAGEQTEDSDRPRCRRSSPTTVSIRERIIT